MISMASQEPQPAPVARQCRQWHGREKVYITADAPPFFIQHGVQDPVVPVQMSIYLAAKLEQVIGKDKVRLELLEGAGHGDPKFETPENVQKVLDWLDRRLKRAE